MRNILNPLRARLLAGIVCAGAAMAAPAQETIKIGVVGPYTGPFASAGQSFKQGVESFLGINGNKVGGRTVEVIYRDSGGADPSLAKRLAEELVVRDKVSILAGFYLSPEVAAAAPVSAESKTPLLMPNAATPALIRMSPYFVRLGITMSQPAELAALHARKAGKSRGYVAVADYGPGHLVEQAFMAKFTAEGGTMTGNVRIPLNTTDFSPFAERIANANPDVLQVFVPPGAAAVSFVKALAARGLTGKLMIIGQGEADDSELPQFDDAVLGYQSVINFDAYAENTQSKAMTAWLAKNVGPTARPNSLSIGTYDAMRVAYKMIADQAGKPFNGDAAMKAVSGYTFESPRGMVTLEPVRELTQDFYGREVVKGPDGVKRNRVIQKWEKVPPTAK
ncbi:MAG TPA: ABC transporter substrate-binding protein [Burkholderiaceae bacterium]|nr:ABC transporter substrate-binding protein [Burkholderiaceae bacterium]